MRLCLNESVFTRIRFHLTAGPGLLSPTGGVGAHLSGPLTLSSSDARPPLYPLLSLCYMRAPPQLLSLCPSSSSTSRQGYREDLAPVLAVATLLREADLREQENHGTSPCSRVDAGSPEIDHRATATGRCAAGEELKWAAPAGPSLAGSAIAQDPEGSQAGARKGGRGRGALT